MHSAYNADGPPDPELIRVRDLLYRVAGIFHPDNKLCLLFDRCRRRMKELQVPSLGGYFERLTTHPARQLELIALLNEITIGETCFFRNQAQLQALRYIVIPKILATKASLAVKRLRIWSAGCSTLEEPYAISMLLFEEAHSALAGDWARLTFEMDSYLDDVHSLVHAIYRT